MKLRVLYSMRILVLFFLAQWLPLEVMAPNFIDHLKFETERITRRFHERMDEFMDDDDRVKGIPIIVFSERVSANAVWKNDTIHLGQSFFTQSFLTDEDRFSILYHECQHYACDINGIFPCQTDMAGNIIQVETGTTFTRELSHAEINQDYSEMVKESMSEAEKVFLWEMLSKPCVMRFRYSPSNLAREEIFCYRSEVKANEIGMFRHSNAYADFLHYRIKREQAYLKMRIDFERKNGLKPDGSCM